MLLTQAARDVHSELERRWKALDQWLADPQHAAGAAKVSKAVDVFRRHWKEVDHGLLSDSDEVCGAYPDLETAESHAMDAGYPKPALHGHPFVVGESCTVRVARDTASSIPVVGQTAVEVDDHCLTHPSDAICEITAPQGGKTWCERTGAPNFVCSEWFPYALAAVGLALVGGAAFVAYKAAPLALAVYAPGLAQRRAARAADEELAGGGLNALGSALYVVHDGTRVLDIVDSDDADEVFGRGLNAARAARPPPDPATMTAGEINRELDKLDRRSSANTDAFIAAGRGHERPNEYLRKDDPLALEARAIWERQSALQREIEARYGPRAPNRLPTGQGFRPRRKANDDA